MKSAILSRLCWPFVTLCAFCCALVVTSCSSHEQTVRIEGHFDHLQQADFYVYSSTNPLSPLDTIHVVQGDFEYERPVQGTEIITLLYPNFSETDIIVRPGDDLTFKADVNELRLVTVKGNDANESFTHFRQSQADKSVREQRLAAEQFIRKDPASLAAIAIFYRYFLRSEQIDASPASELLALIQKSQKGDLVKVISEHYATVVKCGVGASLPAFKCTDIKGHVLKSDTFKGKPLVIVYWAPWSFKCTSQLHMLHQYEQQGRVQLLGIALDVDADNLSYAIDRDTLRFPQVLQPLLYEDDLVQRLGIRGIPGNILVDSHGNIVARDVPEDRLKKAIDALK